MADRKMPWFPVDPVNGLTQSRFTVLTATEMGHVFRAMMYWWLHGKMPEPGDELIATASDRSLSVAEIWITEIHAQQLEKFNAVSERNRENASKTRTVRSVSYQATASDGKRPLATVSHREGERDRELERETTTPLPPKGFDVFWKTYPKKTGKGACEKWWAKNKPNADLVSTMLTTLSWQIRSDAWRKDGGQYVPNPATWLNQKRWNDEPEIAVEPQQTDMEAAGAFFARELQKSGGAPSNGSEPRLAIARSSNALADDAESDIPF